MNNKHSIRTNMLFLSMEKAINGTLSIILIPIMIKAIGIEQYGLWAVFLALFSYLQSMDLGLSFSLERHIAYYHGSKNDSTMIQQFITTSITYMLFLSLVTITILLSAGTPIIRLLIKNQTITITPHLLYLCTLAVTLNFFQSVFMSIPRGFQLFNISSKIQIGGKIVFTITLLLSFLRWNSVLSPLVAYSSQTVFTMAAYVIAAKRIIPELHLLRLGISRSHLKELISFGSKIQVSSVAFLITQHFDKILLSSFFGLSYAGYYEAATKIIYAIRDIPLFLMSVLTPHISQKCAQNDHNSITVLYKKITAQLSIISFILAGLLIINHRYLLTFILKSTPNQFSILVFQLIAATGFWHVISGGSTYVTRGLGKTSVEMNTNILTLSLNITLSLLFLKLFSFSGVVFGTAAALTVSPFLSYILTNRELSLSTPRFLWEAFIPQFATGFLALLPVAAIFIILPHSFPPLASVVLFSVLFLLCIHLSYTITHNRIYQELVTAIPFINT